MWKILNILTFSFDLIWLNAYSKQISCFQSNVLTVEFLMCHFSTFSSATTSSNLSKYQQLLDITNPIQFNPIHSCLQLTLQAQTKQLIMKPLKEHLVQVFHPNWKPDERWLEAAGTERALVLNMTTGSGIQCKSISKTEEEKLWPDYFKTQFKLDSSPQGNGPAWHKAAT